MRGQWRHMVSDRVPDVDLLMGLYANAIVRLAPNDSSNASIAFDTEVAQGALCATVLFLILIMPRVFCYVIVCHGVCTPVCSWDPHKCMFTTPSGPLTFQKLKGVRHGFS